MGHSTIGRALRHWHWLIWGMALVAGILALGISYGRDPTYEATALVSIDQAQETNQGFDVAMQTDQFLSQRFVSMATSGSVLQKVCANEGFECSPTALSRQVRVTTTKATSQIQIIADASTPSAAARLANNVADALVARNRELTDAQLAPQLKNLQDQVKQLGDQVTRTAQQAPGNEAIASQLTLQQTQYSNTYQRLQDLQAQQSKLENVISVTDRAGPPSRPADPDPLRYLLVGVTAGLVGGAVAALMVERLRDRIYDGSELGEATGSPLVLDLSRRPAAEAPDPFAFLAHAIVAGRPAGVQSLVLAATSRHADVNAVGLGLAQPLAGHVKRILVELAPIPGEPAPERMDLAAGQSSTITALSRARSELRPAEEFDMIIRCIRPPIEQGGDVWSEPVPGRGILVASRRRSRFSQARRAAELLRYVGVEIVGTVLLPPRLKASREKAPRETEQSPRQAAAAER
jgi:capsular polysaccharide biosynthesis protein